MPFKSKKQETYLKINEPKIYKEWKERYGTFKSDTLDNKNEQSKYMAQDKTGYEIPTDDNGSFYMQIRGDKETIQKAFKDWKPKAYPYEKRITQDSLNITCENCGEENVHYQFYLPQKNSRYTRMRFVDGATHCKYDEGNCGANLCSDCADDNDCENCGAEMCSTCADESEYTDNAKICVPCREADEMNAETFSADYSFTGKIKKYGFELSDGGKEYVITYGGRRIPSFRLPKDTYFHGVYTIERFVEELNQNQERAVSDVFNFLWNKTNNGHLDDILMNRAETFEAPYAGLGSLFGFGQDTGLGSFTTSELTESSAIHGDFDSASLNYSGHQAVFARAENEMKNVEFEDWAKQEMKTHGKDVSFKNWAKKEEKSHGNVELMDWAEHEEESHDERYGADMKTYEAYDDKISERQEYLIGKLGGNSNSDMTRSQASDLIKKLQGKRSGTWRAEEDIWDDEIFSTCLGCGKREYDYYIFYPDIPGADEGYCMECYDGGDAYINERTMTEEEILETYNFSDAQKEKIRNKIDVGQFNTESLIEEPDFIPDGDGRALGQQTSSINLSPLHSESKLFNKTNTLIAGVIVIGLWKGKEILDMTMASLKRSAEEKRKGKACGSCNSQGSIRKPHTQVKNSEYSVDQVNPVEVQGQNDIHGAEGVTNPRHSPSSEPFGYPSKSLKMW